MHTASILVARIEICGIPTTSEPSVRRDIANILDARTENIIWLTNAQGDTFVYRGRTLALFKRALEDTYGSNSTKKLNFLSRDNMLVFCKQDSSNVKARKHSEGQNSSTLEARIANCSWRNTYTRTDNIVSRDTALDLPSVLAREIAD